MEENYQIILNQGQNFAVKKMVQWYNLSSNKRYFSLTGSAGTGKSSMLNYAIKEIGLDPIYDVLYATPTGKAALVLKLKGLDACTIHRLIYKPDIIKVPQLGKDGLPILELQVDSEGNTLMDESGQPIYKPVTKNKIVFKKREKIENPNAKLIVIDEGSMVTEKMWEDILSFGIKVVILSDYKQLPPIGSRIISPVLNPDAILTEVMRQGKDSDILIAAHRASEGLMFNNELNTFNSDNYDKVISYKNKEVHIISHHHLTDKLLKNAGIVICGKNKTRDALNKYMREKVYGFKGELPQKGDKIICRRNNNEIFLPSNSDISLINGLIGYVDQPVNLETVKSDTFEIDFRPDFIKDECFKGIAINKSIITNKSRKNKGKELEREEKDHIMNFGKGEKFEYGYAITAHLSQGSEWDTAIVFFEWMADKETMAKWLYTAETRAKKKLIVVRSLPKGEIPYWEYDEA